MAVTNAVSTADQTATAHERADVIRQRLDVMADAWQEVSRLVIEAFNAEDWRTLGYESWPDYVRDEFGTSMVKLDKATRRQWTRALKDAGMSTREIAPVTNVNQATVVRDANASPRQAADDSDDMLRLHKEVGRAGVSLLKIRDMMKAGIQVNCITAEGLAHAVNLVNEIISIGEEREAR